MRLLEPAFDQLAMALGIGIAAGPATPEAKQLLADWLRLLALSNVLAAIALCLVIVGGIPLAGVALVAKYWPRAVATLVRNRTAVWVCLTWQLMNIGFPVLLTVLIASEGLDEMTAVVALVCVVYASVNLLAARAWRELLVRMNAAELAREGPAV